MKNFVYIIIVSLMLGCRNGEIPDRGSFTNTDHYVHGYWIFDDIDIETESGAKCDGYASPVLKIMPSESAYFVSYLSTGDQLDEYYDLCRKYNDFDYDPFGGQSFTGGYSLVDWLMCVFSGIEFSSIDIVSDKDFDETHPAGVSLADIAMLSTFWGRPILDQSPRSAKRGVQSDGTWSYGVIEYGQRLFKRLDALTPYELSVIGMMDKYYYQKDSSDMNFCIGALTFAEAPTQEMEHTFTVTLTTVDGAELTAEAYVRWD